MLYLLLLKIFAHQKSEQKGPTFYVTALRNIKEPCISWKFLLPNNVTEGANFFPQILVIKSFFSGLWILKSIIQGFFTENFCFFKFWVLKAKLAPKWPLRLFSWSLFFTFFEDFLQEDRRIWMLKSTVYWFFVKKYCLPKIRINLAKISRKMTLKICWFDRSNI